MKFTQEHIYADRIYGHRGSGVSDIGRTLSTTLATWTTTTSSIGNGMTRRCQSDYLD